MKTKIPALAAVLVALLAGTAHAATPAVPTGCGLLPSYLANLVSSSAPWYCPINQQIYGVWASYLPFVFIVVLLALTIAAMIFMIGIAFKNDTIRNFGVGELYEGMASALIVVFFIYICAVMFGLGPGIAVGAINPYATAFNLITSTLVQAQGLYSAVYTPYITSSYYISISWTEAIGGQAIPYLSSLPQELYKLPLTIFYILPASALAQLLVDGMAGLYAQYYILVFFSVAAIPAFLAPGIVLRAILPTRSLGGIMISIGIAFFLVMPTLFAVAYYFTAPNLLASMAQQQSQLARWGTGTGAEQNALSATSPLVTALSNVRSAMSSFWLLVLFYPALITAVSYVFITQLANFIGGASRVGGNVRRFI